MITSAGAGLATLANQALSNSNTSRLRHAGTPKSGSLKMPRSLVLRLMLRQNSVVLTMEKRIMTTAAATLPPFPRRMHAKTMSMMDSTSRKTTTPKYVSSQVVLQQHPQNLKVAFFLVVAPWASHMSIELKVTAMVTNTMAPTSGFTTTKRITSKSCQTKVIMATCMSSLHVLFTVSSSKLDCTPTPGRSWMYCASYRGFLLFSTFMASMLAKPLFAAPT
mmetsp:Transcript_9769/g.18415  ORF Transcript_9769/g.18415 Transcript_9769/m.18415 type:complete len:220 (-) Transcript_9769:395-1054(-)